MRTAPVDCCFEIVALAQAGLDFMALVLPQLPMCWDYRSIGSSRLAVSLLLENTLRAICQLPNNSPGSRKLPSWSEHSCQKGACYAFGLQLRRMELIQDTLLSLEVIFLFCIKYLRKD